MDSKKRLLSVYILFLALLSLSISVMPFAVRLSDKIMLLSYLSGIMFWSGLTGTIVSAAVITRSKRKSRQFSKENPECRKIGIIHFFQNRTAAVYDILMGIVFAGLVITCVLLPTSSVPLVFLSLFIFSFGMHCMLNGSNYIYIKTLQKEGD